MLRHIQIHLLILTLWLNALQASPSMRCFAKQYEPAITSSTITPKQQTRIKIITQSQLRSYHPHYLNSLSYPHPITPHIYFGEVVAFQPLFSIKYMDTSDRNIIEKWSVNGVSYKDSSASSFMLNREETYRYMLVIQMENSYDKDIPFSLNLFKRKNHFLVTCQYEDQFHAFAIYLTHNDAILPLGQQELKGIRVNVRNQSMGDSKRNWRFSQTVRWRGFDNLAYPEGTSFTGLVLQLECIDHSFNKGIRINLQELSNDEHLNLQQFVQLEETIDFQAFAPLKTKQVVKNANCSNAAVQKIYEGLSYQYGNLKIKDNFIAVPNLPQALLSFSPSRKRFPWGFLWDDGFHCEVSIRKDEALTLKVIKSWLDTMLDNGWIPREQNRGQEREELCSCPRFMEKDIKDGNPPTLILALQYLRRANRLTTINFPAQYWSKIKKWYNWFLSTQRDDTNVLLFKWKDSINQPQASFTSGMDDFPRPWNAKANIDLQSWMYFFTKFMVQASHIYSQSNTQYINYLELLRSNFKFFIEDKTNVYKDISIDNTHSEHFGYPSILPIAFGIPEYKSKQYDAIIQMIKDHLDTGAGISSISKYSQHYLRTLDAYWRGPVWININYMLLRGLKLYYPEETELYSKIRKDLMRTVCGNWEQKGYFYENYINGAGSFSYPFNGWTSLISIITDENY